MAAFDLELLTLPVTREAAQEAGSKRYFTRLACYNGHFSHRWTATGTCRACMKTYMMRWRDKRNSHRVEEVRQFRPFSPAEDQVIEAARARGLSRCAISRVVKKILGHDRHDSSIRHRLIYLARKAEGVPTRGGAGPS